MFKNKKENEIFKIVELNRKETDYKREYPLLIENGNCVVPEGVTSIANRCFYECSSLTNIQLPSSLISIGKYAFCHECDWESKVPLKQVEVPKNCKIGYKAFDDDCKVIRK